MRWGSDGLPATSRGSLTVALFLAVTAVGGLVLGFRPLSSSATAHAQSLNRVGLVVGFGDGSYITRCVVFSEPAISGLDMLMQSDLDVVVAGGTVCDIEGESGCPAEDCFCQCPVGGGSCVYWSYWHLVDGSWVYATSGSGSYSVSDGDVDGWAWGTEAPSVVPFDEICTPSALADRLVYLPVAMRW